MYNRFDTNKSTKGASKLRRDLINAEIANLRDLLPLPASTRQRLSQLQLMALVCVYVRKTNYFQQAFKCRNGNMQSVTPSIGFSKALNGFLMMMTQNGKLVYISDNAAEYLGHSMEDLLIHGDSVYDIIDKQDHPVIQAEMVRSASSENEPRTFMCRINVTRNVRRQMRFGDQKVVLVQGHYLSFLPLCSRNEPVFIATCTPVAMPETRECVVQGATNVFTSIHSMDMKFMYLDQIGEHHLDYLWVELQGVSWYKLLHWECMQEAQVKHRLITQSDQDRACILLVRLQKGSGDWLWVHCVLQVKDNIENNQNSVIVCTNQVLSEREAAVMRSNSWLYNYYTVQSKLQYRGNPQTANYYPTPPPVHTRFPTVEKAEPVDYSVHPGYDPACHQTHTVPRYVISPEEYSKHHEPGLIYPAAYGTYCYQPTYVGGTEEATGPPVPYVTLLDDPDPERRKPLDYLQKPGCRSRSETSAERGSASLPDREIEEQTQPLTPAKYEFKTEGYNDSTNTSEDNTSFVTNYRGSLSSEQFTLLNDRINIRFQIEESCCPFTDHNQLWLRQAQILDNIVLNSCNIPSENIIYTQHYDNVDSVSSYMIRPLEPPVPSNLYSP